MFVEEGKRCCGRLMFRVWLAAMNNMFYIALSIQNIHLYNYSSSLYTQPIHKAAKEDTVRNETRSTCKQ